MTPLKPFRGVIFDMDGVIIDSEPVHERAFREVFAEIGKSEDHGIHFPDYFGKSDVALWRDFVAVHQPVQPLEELVRWKQTRFIEMIRKEQPIFDDFPDLVEKLAARFPLALASGSSHPVIDEVLAMRGLRRFFPVVVSAQDVAKGKPAPDIFLRAAELMGVLPEACCVVEDSAAGVTGANAAGMQSIAITNSLPPALLTHASRTVKTYAELEKLLVV